MIIQDESSETFDFEKYKKMMFMHMLNKAGISESDADLLMMDALKWRESYMESWTFKVFSTIKVMKGQSLGATYPIIDPVKP